ncbi:aminoacyl-tRNA hydrolase [Saccharomycopsis crataegensis]|uniref:peptidyl-tRNA hydrolase n=1 Tax=Saccharomycopsis crataegensis TaxID=43959 RepID=A0AAV5QNR8_9ASCO|nr:aminoacyl-tRNA hydrolase [Saccharomycopsis crataegensis]
MVTTIKSESDRDAPTRSFITKTKTMANNNLITYLTIGGVSLLTGIFIGKTLVDAKQSEEILTKKRIEDEDDEDEEYDSEDEDEPPILIDSTPLNEIPGEVRMIFAIRMDLGMTKGKSAAQVGHAAVGLYKQISNPSLASYNPTLLQRWERSGQAKITVKCPDEEQMDMLFAMAVDRGVNSLVIHDAGRTQIASGSATVLGLGPAPKAVLDSITGELKLY